MAPSAKPLENALMSAEYIFSPLDTIFSTNVSIHDIIEAYSVFSARLRAHFHTITIHHHHHHHTPLPALSVLAHNASLLSRALIRDIHHALTNPLQSLYPADSSCPGMSSNDLQYARDLTTLSHHALRLLSSIFVLKPLYSLFTEQDIQHIFDELLTIALAPNLPTPHADKTWSLVFWIMAIQTLPFSILSLRITDIVTALKQSFSNQKGLQAKLDSFEVIHNILKRHPEFVSHLVDILPLVLDNLASRSGECRFRACHALAGFALAKLHIPSSASWPHDAVLSTLQTFIDKHSSESTQHTPPSPSLPHLLTHSFSSRPNSPQSPSQTKNPSWTTVLLSSLITLSDSSIFSHPNSLRFVLEPLRYASKHRNGDIRAAHGVVWRVLVWAFGRLIAVERGVGVGVRPGEGGHLDAVFKTVAQEVKDGIGVALVALLFGPSAGTGTSTGESESMGRDVSRGLVVIKKMVHADPREGVFLLNRIVSAIGSASSSSSSNTHVNLDPIHLHFHPHSVFDGTLLQTPLHNLRTSLRKCKLESKSKLGVHAHVDVDVERVRQLEEEEVIQHWDGIVEIWIEGVEVELRGAGRLGLCVSFCFCLSLLLVQAHLTQTQTHAQDQEQTQEREDSRLTASSNFARRVASIAVQVLCGGDHAHAHAGVAAGVRTRERIQRMVLVQKLWGVMKNVFERAWLPVPAEIVFAGLLKLDLDPCVSAGEGEGEEGGDEREQEEVKSAWRKLCADLVDVGIPTVMHIVNVRGEEGVGATRLLWGVLAGVLERPDEYGYVHWDDVVRFLGIPLRSWVMSDSELRIWGCTLRTAVSMASASALGTRSNQVVRRVIDRMEEDEKTKLTAFPEVIAILLRHITLSDIDNDVSLPIDILSPINATLVSLYPPPPESLMGCLKILHHIGEIISSAPTCVLVPLLTTLEESFRLWIGDSDEVLSEADFNDIVNDVYCRTLDSLHTLEPCLDTLLAISPFLSTAFTRIPPPAIGPMAFECFWRGTYHELVQYRPFYPDCLKACLMGFTDVCGGSLGGGLSVGTVETQATHMSTVPDSQPFLHGEVGSTQLHFGVLGEHSSRYPIPVPIFDPLEDETLKRCSGGSSSTPGSSSEPTRHPPDYMAALQQLNGYDSLRSLEEPAGGMSTTDCRLDTDLTPPPLRSSPRLISTTTSDIWGLHQEKMPSPSSSSSSSDINLHYLIPTSSPRANERKRPSDDHGADMVLHSGSSLAGSLSLSLVQQQSAVGDRPLAKRRKTDSDSGIHFRRSLVQNNKLNNCRRAQSESDVVEVCAVPHDQAKSNLPMKNESSNTSIWRVGFNGERVVRSHSPGFPGEDPPGTSSSGVWDDRHEMSLTPLEDYDTWEASVSIEETRKLKKELVESDCASDSDTIETADDGSEPSEEIGALSPILTSATIRKQTRSKTAPGSIPVRPPPPTPLPVRRYQTVGASTRLDALQRAYTAVVNDESQVAVEDLIQATALVKRIGTRLNEQVERKLKTASRSGRVIADSDEHS